MSILWSVRSCNGRKLPMEEWRMVRGGCQVGGVSPLNRRNHFVRVGLKEKLGNSISELANAGSESLVPVVLGKQTN